MQSQTRATSNPRSINKLFALALPALLAAACTQQVAAPAQERPFPRANDPMIVAEGDALAAQLVADPSGLGLVTHPLALEGDSDRLGLRFDARNTPTVEGRVSLDGGESFGPWQDFTITWQEEVAHNGHLDISPKATHAQLRFRVKSASELIHLFVEDFHLQPEAGHEAFVEEPGELEPLGHEHEMGVHRQALVADRPGVVLRAQWQSRVRNCSGSHSPNRITIHHSDTPTKDSISPPARVRQIQSYHIDNNQWCDIGYHFLIGQDGKIYQGRPEGIVGAHVGGNNTHNFGFSLLGNYTSAKPVKDMLDQAVNVLTWASADYGIAMNSDKVKGHRDYGGTTCPGDALYAELPKLIAAAGGNGNGGTNPPQTGTVRGVIFWGYDFNTDLNDPSRRLSNATVKLGSKTVYTDASGNYVFENISPGSHQVTASASGYVPNSSTVTVSANGTAWGSIMLAKTPSPDQTAIVISSPIHGSSTTASSVLVKGSWQGSAPSSITVDGWEATLSGTSFQRTINLQVGSNTVNVVAYGSNGREAARQVLEITRNAPADDPEDIGGSSGGCSGLPDVNPKAPWLPKGTGQAAILLLGTFAAAMGGRRRF